MKLCSEYPCPNEAKYRIGGFEDYDTYCLEHWAIEQKDAVTALREQIAREQAEYLSHWQDFYLDTYPDDVVDCVGRDLLAIARGK